MKEYTKLAIIFAFVLSLIVPVLDFWSNSQYTSIENENNKCLKKRTQYEKSIVQSISAKQDSIASNGKNVITLLSTTNNRLDSLLTLQNQIIKNQKKLLRKK